MMALLEVTELTKKFAEKTVVDAISFTLEEGTSTALIGPNGAGKTTTLSMLTGLLKPSFGNMSIQGNRETDFRSQIGFLPQYPQFQSWLTALEFAEMAAVLSGVASKKAKKEALETLEFVGLQDAVHKKIATFSGGMKQRLGIAQAIVHKPKLLLLDEPVSALDPVGRREVMDLLKSLQQQTTILYSTHILNDAEEMTDQLLFLRDGQLVEQGTLAEVRNRYEEPNIVVEFSVETEALQFINQFDINASARGRYAYIAVNDGQPKMQQILEKLAVSPFTVRKVERQTASLEEIFMKVAKR